MTLYDVVPLPLKSKQITDTQELTIANSQKHVSECFFVSASLGCFPPHSCALLFLLLSDLFIYVVLTFMTHSSLV